jgi:hypothetical protein
MADRLDRQRRPQLDREALDALWQDVVPLRIAWLVFADESSATRFRELQRTDSHLGFQRALQIGFVARLYAGERPAIGVEDGSDAGKILIDQCYFSETAEVDWKKGVVVALGRKFHEVKVRWEREPPDKTRPPKPVLWIHPRELEAQWELGPPCGPEPFPGDQWEWDETPRSEPTPSQKRPCGRHSVVPEVTEVVSELMAGGRFSGQTMGEIERLVATRARERFPELFPKSTRPSRNTIYRALAAGGWPPWSRRPGS